MMSFHFLIPQYYITDRLDPLVQFVYAKRSYCSFIPCMSTEVNKFDTIPFNITSNFYIRIFHELN